MSEIVQSPSRQVKIPGSRNLRDLGGYPAAIGGQARQVRWGRLYRSGHFGELTAEGYADLEQLGIRRVIDLRMPQEREKQPSRFDPEHGPRVHEIPIDPGSRVSFGRSIADKGTTEQIMITVMEEMNRSLVRDHADCFREMFAVLRSGVDTAQVIHCASGKDRTGVGCALLLAALGVEREVILADFMLTNSILKVEREVGEALKDFGGAFSKHDLPPERLRPMFEVRASYLLAAFDEIDREFGGTLPYLRDKIGLGESVLEELRDVYLSATA
jgi:protein-tyrosine phosphatase